MVKNPVRTLGQEDPLEEGMATQSSLLTWRIPIDGAWGHKESGRTDPLAQHSARTRTHTWKIVQSVLLVYKRR